MFYIYISHYANRNSTFIPDQNSNTDGLNAVTNKVAKSYYVTTRYSVKISVYSLFCVSSNIFLGFNVLTNCYY